MEETGEQGNKAEEWVQRVSREVLGGRSSGRLSRVVLSGGRGRVGCV